MWKKLNGHHHSISTRDVWAGVRGGGGGEVLPDRYQSVSNYALAIKLSINNNSSYSMQVFFCYEKGPLPFQCTKQWAILILLLYVV